MRWALRSTLAQFCWRSGLLSGFQYVASKATLRRGKRNGRPVFPYFSRRSQPNFQILTYHRFVAANDPFFAGMPVEVFDRQIRFLSRYYQVVDLGQLMRRLDEGGEIPPNVVALTFDDGYRDNYELAYPVLQRYGVPATIFLATGFVNRQELLWNDKVRYALKHTNCQELILNFEGERRYPLQTSGQRLAAACDILYRFFHILHSEKLRLVDEICAQLKVRDFGELWDSMLTWKQIQEMNKAGISFGAHTVTHPILSRLPLDHAREEILQSKRNIEERLDAPVDLFAYPVGRPVDFNEELKSVVRKLGFRAAVSTIFGTNTADTDRYALCRGGADEPDLAMFASKQCWYKFAF